MPRSWEHRLKKLSARGYQRKASYGCHAIWCVRSRRRVAVNASGPPWPSLRAIPVASLWIGKRCSDIYTKMPRGLTSRGATVGLMADRLPATKSQAALFIDSLRKPTYNELRFTGTVRADPQEKSLFKNRDRVLCELQLSLLEVVATFSLTLL